MSFREQRSFCEIMRSLGFNRIISIQNFKLPNFKLLAEILYWFIQRFDPNAEIPINIHEDKDRVEFIRWVGEVSNYNDNFSFSIKILKFSLT